MNRAFSHTRKSITLRLTVAVCAFLILFQAILAGLTFYSFKREFKANIAAQQATLLTVLTQNIDHKLSSSLKVIVDVARLVTPEIAADSDAAQAFLDNRPGTLSLFDNGLFLFSAEGRIIAESPYRPERRGRDIAFREYYQRTIASNAPVISEPYISTHTPGAPAVIFTAPVRDRDGKLIAILGGSLNLQRDNFLGELARTRIAESGYLYLVARDRTVIMHPDKSRIMQIPAPAGTDRLLEAAHNGFEGTAEHLNAQGVRTLTSFKHLHAADWVMGTDYPVAEAYAAIYRLQRYLLAAALLGALVIVFGIRLMTVRFTRTLEHFARHVREIGNKQGEERLFPAATDDEIGVLARTFNAMIQEQDRNNAELLKASTHDALTGLYNRAYFDSELERFARGRQLPISVVVADIDDLKGCNDNFGHAAGDALIRAAARVLLESFRAEDIVARIGGDEFAVLLPGVDAEHVAQALARVRSAETAIQGDCALSIALGAATCANAEALMETFKAADQAMYRDKAAHKQTPA